MSKLIKSAEIKRNNILDSINKTQLAIHKFVKAEEIADKHLNAIKKLKSANKNLIDLRIIETDLKVNYSILNVNKFLKYTNKNGRMLNLNIFIYLNV